MRAIRRQRQVELGALYHRVSGIDMARCAYCGHFRECLDHVPPLSVADTMDMEAFRRNGGSLLLVPSCFECNARLSAKRLASFAERVSALHEIYSRLIRPSRWSSEELAQLGRGLKSFVAKKQRTNNEWISKLRGIEELLLGTRPYPIPFHGDDEVEKKASAAVQDPQRSFSGPRKIA